MSLVLLVVVGLIFYLATCIRIFDEYERAVIFRLGKILKTTKGPGLIFVFWPVDRAVKVSLRLVALDVPPQDIITKDNVSASVNAVTYYKVVDPIKAIIEVEDYEYATSQMAQTTLRSVIGEMELDSLLSQRDKINSTLQAILDEQTDPWGIKITSVEVKHVDLTEELKKAMARQAEAERERRAKIISAEGEFQAADKICKAAKMMEKTPMALQLRYLQTAVEIGSDKNTTTFFPLPIELLDTLINKKK
jgi:regulator of protease activity HflC (stomatin/prohibitin superfamily)